MWADTSYCPTNRKIDSPQFIHNSEDYVKLLSPYAKDYCLEIGCGDGSIAELLARVVDDKARLVATEISFRLVHKAKEESEFARDNIDFVVADATALPFRNGVFEFTYALGVLHHIVNLNKSIDDVIRVTKSVLLFVEPNIFSYQFLVLGSKAPLKGIWKGQMDPNERPLNPFHIKKHLNRSGFMGVKVFAKSTLPREDFLKDLFKIDLSVITRIDKVLTHLVNKIRLGYFTSTFVLIAKR